MIRVFSIAFIVSFLGSVPPGTINITTMQLSVRHHQRAALFFALAASLTEFVYAGVTVKFQIFLSDQPAFTQNFQLITALAMIVLGIVNLIAKKRSTKSMDQSEGMKGRNGFKRGVVLGLLNPLTIPFWLAVTAYLQNHQLITLSGAHFWWYLAGISTGTFALLLSVMKLGLRFSHVAENEFIVYKIPGIIFLLLGLYNIIDWLA